MIGLSLFSGVGGLDLAFEWAGGTVAAMCEIDPFCRKVLRTPTANDAKCNGTASQQNRNSEALNVVAGGSLNPEWVEALMGFPRGWTEIGRTEFPE